MSLTLSPVRVQRHAWNLWKDGVVNRRERYKKMCERKEEWVEIHYSRACCRKYFETSSVYGKHIFSAASSPKMRRIEDVWAQYQHRLHNLLVTICRFIEKWFPPNSSFNRQPTLIFNGYFLTSTTDQHIWSNLGPYLVEPLHLHPTFKRIIQSDLLCLPPCLLSL